MGGACFQRRQLVAVFDASFSVFQMTLEISHINRMGGEGDFRDIAPTYAGNVTNMAVLLRVKIKSLRRNSRCLRISSNVPSIVLQSSSFS